MSTPPSATPIAAAPETLRADVIVVGGGLVGPGASKAAPSAPASAIRWPS
ncbi:hypothetical protein [Azoarcus sp. TTM-91]|nr:hypothetical protein [Azoarcus sp. TTM-91]